MENVNNILILIIGLTVISLPTILGFAFFYAIDHAGKND